MRSFKTSWFAKAAKKARISDKDLVCAIEEIMRGQVDNLGGGVFKKRLNQNRYRAIILTKAGNFWVFEYLFAKNNRDNIDEAELKAFRKLAGAYETMSPLQLDELVKNKDLIDLAMEILH